MFKGRSMISKSENGHVEARPTVSVTVQSHPRVDVKMKEHYRIMEFPAVSPRTLGPFKNPLKNSTPERCLASVPGQVPACNGTRTGRNAHRRASSLFLRAGLEQPAIG